MTVDEKVRQAIRDIPDFPKPGILFKDITPILENPLLCTEITEALSTPFLGRNIHAIVGVESRGFLFGMLMAQRFQVPFIPVRKAGKLPHRTISYSYSLEYGTATIEMHEGVLQPGWNVLVHDDLLATGGTAAAAAELIRQQGATVSGFSFLVELRFLDGRKILDPYSKQTVCLVDY